jgi:LysM repeat protein
MRRAILILTTLGLAFLLVTTVTYAQATSGYDVVASVNDFRAAYGLPPLKVDPILMSIAQAHSDYQASISTVTHSGPGGSSPKDRAYAAGFGGGATIFLSENIAGGLNMSIQTAIYQYWQDQAHLDTMLNPAAVFIGAGVGYAGDYVYYTVDAGYYSGAPSLGNAAAPSPGSTVGGPTAIVYDPFVISTPQDDGEIVHTVGFGQTLIGIANTYKVELDQILQLNNLTLDSVIHPGDKILIQESSTPTTTPSPTKTQPTDTPTITATRNTPTPRGTFTQRPTLTITPTLTPTPISAGRERLVISVVIMAMVVFLVVIVSGFTAGRTRKSTND